MRRILMILALAVGMASCGSSASGNGSQWLRVIHHSDVPHPEDLANYVAKYCDIETGNLVYLYGDPRGGIAVVPGGCK